MRRVISETSPQAVPCPIEGSYCLGLCGGRSFGRGGDAVQKPPQRKRKTAALRLSLPIMRYHGASRPFRAVCGASLRRVCSVSVLGVERSVVSMRSTLGG